MVNNHSSLDNLNLGLGACSLKRLISNLSPSCVRQLLVLSVFTSQPTVSDESYFLEKLEENHYNTYRPQKYLERKWYVALKKSGKPKVGPRTHIGQKAVFFLPRQLDDSGE